MSKEEIIKKIESGEVKMKPKIYFTLASLILGVGMSGVVLLHILVTNFIFHRLKMVRELGVRHPPMFLRFFPWEFLLISLGLVGLGVYLYRKYEFSYKKGLLPIILSFILGTTLIGFLVNRSGINERLARRPHFDRFYNAIERKAPPQMYYRQYRNLPPRR